MKPLILLSLIGLVAFAGAQLWPEVQGITTPTRSPSLTVHVYLDPDQPAGWEAEQFFRSRGLAVEVRDVTASSFAHAEYIRLGGGPLPLIHVGAERLSGFDRRTAERVVDRLERAPLVR